MTEIQDITLSDLEPVRLQHEYVWPPTITTISHELSNEPPALREKNEHDQKAVISDLSKVYFRDLDNAPRSDSEQQRLLCDALREKIVASENTVLTHPLCVKYCIRVLERRVEKNPHLQSYLDELQDLHQTTESKFALRSRLSTEVESYREHCVTVAETLKSLRDERCLTPIPGIRF